MTAAPAFMLSANAGSDNMTVYLYAQNRGTEPLDTVTLSIDVGGTQQVFTYDKVGVGDTVSHEFTLTSNLVSIAGSIDIKHSIKILGPTDTYPGNNVHQSVMTYRGK